MSRKPSRTPEIVAVLNLLRDRGAATLAELRPHLPADAYQGQLLKRLSNMADRGWLLQEWSSDGERLWLIAPSARAALPKPPAPAALVLVPPRRINVMVGTYTPPPMAPARPGALDYQRCASQGVRC